MVPSIALPIALFCDNNGAIALVKEPRSHQKSKHIEQKYHIVREYQNEKKIISIQKVASSDNVADPLTKALSLKDFNRHLEKMGLMYKVDWH